MKGGELTSGSVPNSTGTGLARRLEDIDGLGSAAHVGTLRNDANTGLDECLGFFTGYLILGGTREGDVDGGDKSPGTLAWDMWSGTIFMKKRKPG